MDRVFSVEEISGNLWPEPAKGTDMIFALGESDGMAKMNRSASEWAFHQFIQESSSAAGVDASGGEGMEAFGVSTTGSPTPNVPVDSEEYRAYLKDKLNLACAAVAVKMETPKNSSVPAMSITSASDISGDEEADGEMETSGNMGSLDVKRVKRMLSNRESARRSRTRKHAQLSELQTQVSQLHTKNSAVSKHLADITRTYNDAAIENRVLKANVETLRAKVKMAEETVKRITGMNPIFPPIPDIAAPIQVISQPHPSNTAGAELSPATSKSFAGGYRMGRTASSLHRVASLEHLQKRIRSSGKP